MMRSLLMTLLLFSLSTSATEIFMMDTVEFKTVRNEKAKREYIKAILGPLRALKVKQGDFDATKSDHHEVYELVLSSERWSEVMKQVDELCLQASNAKSCVILMRVRLDTFDYIKRNPRQN
ncbi:MAG: hypothetical protein KF799_04220 [Bdellovibrionales bacterium]|nr:hypothetical protein [Bdellovibrionales bacterium]